MKKISLKTIRKSFNLKGKEDGELVIQQPVLAADFKDDALFGGCYSKDLANCDLGRDDDKGPKSRSKSESLMGTLKRRLSAKQKPKAKGGSLSADSVDEDTFSSSSAPITFNDAKAQRPLRSTSLRSHHYSPSPWPLRPASSEQTCIQMEVKVKALVHTPSPSPSMNGVRKDFHDLQMDGLFPGSSDALKSADPLNGDLHLDIDHVPVELGLTPQDYIQYTMPLDEGLFPVESSRSFCLDSSSPMEVVPPLESSSLHVDDGAGDPDLVMSPELFMDSSLNGLLMGVARGGMESASAQTQPPSPLLPLLPVSHTHRNFPGFTGADPQVAERVRHHLNFDPNSAPGVGRVYDAVQSSGPMVVTSLTAELKKLARQGWYWGPITRWEAEEKLASLLDGSFLVRDSSDDRYLLSLSFRSQSKTLHTRIEHSNGRFSFYEQPDVEGHTSIVDLIEHSIKDSENGAFCYSRSRLPGSVTYPVRLTNPVSRFMQVRSLQYLCRFVIRQYTRIDLIQKLPLPNKMKDYLQEKHY
ncbi:suppressor of cytokine signaling 6b [Paramormyrops kingsleyae]|uniref:suppressor of cytokine signaling 6b n=1 Tax=Paramormyrops kingsleyae TaxID=1676925 RepID=UPI000CD651D1|nr:suppressor of cytokine signaling 6-like [Paramormyrops kingsleyae]XP_023701270.1 suppressor of cytokine signaling 6-like [Paramormyrops kingsleyae]